MPQIATISLSALAAILPNKIQKDPCRARPELLQENASHPLTATHWARAGSGQQLAAFSVMEQGTVRGPNHPAGEGRNSLAKSCKLSDGSPTENDRRSVTAMRHIRRPNMSTWTHIRREAARPLFKNLRVHCTNNQGLASVFASAIAMPKGRCKPIPALEPPA